MKAILIYSSLTGRSTFHKHIDYVKRELSKKFSTLDIVKSEDLETLKNTCLLACKEYDYFIFVGGDGTVNSIINFIGKEERKPILAYIPGGTTNDFAHNFKLSKHIKKAVKNIVNGVPQYFDVCKANDMYFTYVLACGVFSEISYSAKRDLKKKIGSLAYYTRAIKDAMVPKSIKGMLICNGETYNVKTPFLLVLNGNHVGGFYVNRKNNINDGKFNIFITRQGLFNGLLHYLFFKVRTDKIITDHFKFSFKDKNEAWCLDGEYADLKTVECSCLRNFAQIIVPKKVANRLDKLNKR